MPAKHPKRRSAKNVIVPKNRDVETFIYFGGIRRTVKLNWQRLDGSVYMTIKGEEGHRIARHPPESAKDVSIDVKSDPRERLYLVACEAAWRAFPEIFFSDFFVETKKQKKLVAKLRQKRRKMTEKGSPKLPKTSTS